jgi:ATP-dependent Clp protease adaptor protein ClpS
MSDPLTPPGGGTDVQERDETKVTPPAMYRVILVNDDYTPREFVTAILVSVFKQSQSSARRIMLSAHQGGKAIVGVYTYDVANSRVEKAKKYARAAGYPLMLYTEEV